uniref:Light-independent protochlorophyllide reductase subunit B n=1 Tax=Cryptomonas curvata TaxID=233186 RepID=A0A222AHF8_9CRYP|nr:ligh-independent protochlorophyllide oxidoreductase subunit B [Cryptomonas curvata]ASO75809.1 ligh-independent protochlorophyllide oxidoreductase subunit B [Cryptomonas curvata]
MKLAYWMYAGPAHIGTLRVASSFKNVHAIMHAPLGDDYFNVMKSMLEREREFTPVTASVVDRHVLARGSQEKVVSNITRKDSEEQPDLIVLTPTCTSSILQEDLQNFVNRASLESKADVLLADVNHYRVNEFQAADKTLEQIVEFYLLKSAKYNTICVEKTPTPSVNIIGSFCLGFHNQHDISDKKIISRLRYKSKLNFARFNFGKRVETLPKAWFNVVPYRETGLMAAEYLKKEFKNALHITSPIGIIETASFIREIQRILNEQGVNISFEDYIHQQTKFISQSSWFSRSIDCQNLTGKRAVVFGDATHAAAITKILCREMGIHVSWAGTYCKNDSEWFRGQVEGLCDHILITEDHSLVADLIAKTEPSAIFGTQMERHIGKRLNIPCGVISSPVHIQNFPLSYKPFMGYEGSNQIADLVYNSFTLGMEDHLLELFGGHDTTDALTTTLSADDSLRWSSEATKELSKIPGFVRGKIKRNTEKFARDKNLSEITLETMYAAKETVGA